MLYSVQIDPVRTVAITNLIIYICKYICFMVDCITELKERDSFIHSFMRHAIRETQREMAEIRAEIQFLHIV